jgi:hypothetical protein
MANKILHKRSFTAGKKPAATQLEWGEIAINAADGVAYIKKNDGGTEVVTTLAGTPEAAADELGYELTVKDADPTNPGTKTKAEWSPIRTNKIVLEKDYALDPGTSATVASGFTIDTGVTLDIPAGSVLVVC